ncbi:hypothetical protein ABZ446_41085 [Streptomyces sp. NPDC005813]|uniref:hypothetical protein n=1 Tax=Streptomyces sp. NPDC005813 TaxID=3155592 RepID=UPI0033F8CD28
MTEQGTTGSFYLRYWQPTAQVETGCHVAGVAEVVAHADQAAQIYLAAGVDCLAGVSLWRGADIPENSLSLAIGPTRWAVIHTDDEFWQTVTRGPRSPERTLRRVRFDDQLEIPSDCFIDRTLAIDTVSLWMTKDALLQAAGFSDDLFS